MADSKNGGLPTLSFAQVWRNTSEHLGHRDRVHFNLFPIEADSFKEICGLFDEVDEWFKIKGMRAWQYAESGLDLGFDEKSISEMLAAANTSASFEDR